MKPRVALLFLTLSSFAVAGTDNDGAQARDAAAALARSYQGIANPFPANSAKAIAFDVQKKALVDNATTNAGGADALKQGDKANTSALDALTQPISSLRQGGKTSGGDGAVNGSGSILGQIAAQSSRVRAIGQQAVDAARLSGNLLTQASAEANKRTLTKAIADSAAQAQGARIARDVATADRPVKKKKQTVADYAKKEIIGDLDQAAADLNANTVSAAASSFNTGVNDVKAHSQAQ